MMADLIDRQAAINAIEEHIKARLDWVTDSRLERQGLNVAMCAVEDLPSADAVEVVRCKDCKHHIFDGDRWLCKLLSNNYEPVVEMDDDGYCSYGDKGGE